MSYYNIPNLSKYKINTTGTIKSFKRKNPILIKDCNRKGYRAVTLIIEGKRKTFSIHRLMAITFMGLPFKSELVVDHINGIKDDNRLENLQILTNRQNVSKGYSEKETSSKYTGVFKNANSWTATIYMDNKYKNLGTFKIEVKAAEAYQKALENIKNENK